MFTQFHVKEFVDVCSNIPKLEKLVVIIALNRIHST